MASRSRSQNYRERPQQDRSSNRSSSSNSTLPFIVTGLESKTPPSSTASRPRNTMNKTCPIPHHKQLSKKLKHFESELAREKRLGAANERLAAEKLEKVQDQLDSAIAEQKIAQKTHQETVSALNSELEKLREANAEFKQEIHTLKVSNLQKDKAIGMLKGEISKGFTSKSKDRQEQIKVFQAEIVKLREKIAQFIQQERLYKEQLEKLNEIPKRQVCLACPEKDIALKEALHAIKLRDQRLAQITDSAKSMTGTLAFQDLLIDRIEAKHELKYSKQKMGDN